MKLELFRTDSNRLCTMGKLALNGVFECFTLEPPEDGPSGHQCIPAGSYPVELYASKHFDRIVPLLKDVPGHDYIEIHMGNTDADTHGCILVGNSQMGSMLVHSVIAFERLLPKIQTAIEAGEPVSIEIHDKAVM